MDSLQTTNRLLLLIAIASFAHLILAFSDRPLGAETFRLDSCITDKRTETPGSYVHVITHSPTEIDSP